MRGAVPRVWRALVAGFLVAGLMPGLVRAADRGGTAPAASVDGPAWLARINAAATGLNYRGVMVFTAPGVVSSSRVAHLCIGDDVYERLQALDGQLHRVYRHNESVQTVWPMHRRVVVEPKALSPGLVSTRRQVEPRVLDRYTLRLVGSGHVAGRPAKQLQLDPLDDLRFAQRLWADDESGLLLRTDVVDANGHTLESSAFTEVEIGGRPTMAELTEGSAPSGYAVQASTREAVDWIAQGWGPREPVPGFALQGCVRRPAPNGDGENALQAVFSDGLSYVSIFIEPYREQFHARALAAELGAMHTVMQRVGAHWVTAIGEVPRHTLERFIGALKWRPEAPAPSASR